MKAPGLIKTANLGGLTNFFFVDPSLPIFIFALKMKVGDVVQFEPEQNSQKADPVFKYYSVCISIFSNFPKIHAYFDSFLEGKRIIQILVFWQ